MSSRGKIQIIVVFVETQRSKHFCFDMGFMAKMIVHEIVEMVQKQTGWSVADYDYQPFLDGVATHEYVSIVSGAGALKIVSKAPTPPELIEDSHPLLAEMRRSGLA